MCSVIWQEGYVVVTRGSPEFPSVSKPILTKLRTWLEFICFAFFNLIALHFFPIRCSSVYFFESVCVSLRVINFNCTRSHVPHPSHWPACFVYIPALMSDGLLRRGMQGTRQLMFALTRARPSSPRAQSWKQSCVCLDFYSETRLKLPRISMHLLCDVISSFL